MDEQAGESSQDMASLMERAPGIESKGLGLIPDLIIDYLYKIKQIAVLPKPQFYDLSNGIIILLFPLQEAFVDPDKIF